MVVTFRLMPDSMRRKRVSQKNAPRTITKWDLHDEFGESPYRVTEVVADKLWSTVQYSTVQYSTGGGGQAVERQLQDRGPQHDGEAGSQQGRGHGVQPSLRAVQGQGEHSLRNIHTI